MSVELDIGPLSWVKGEIDLALERAGESLKVYAADTSGDGLTKARAGMHQAHGALAIVGLEGITEFANAIEQLLAALGDGSAKDGEAALAAAHGGFAALRGYLDDLMAGHPDQPLKLHSSYSAMAVARGLAAPGPSALFFPDLTQRPPKREREAPALAPEAMTARIKAARLGFERGLLKWLKGDSKGAAEMKISTAMLEMTRGTPAARSYWWISLGVLDALTAGGLPDANEAKRFAMRLGAQVKKLSEGQAEVNEQALREALYLAACATKGGAPLAVVRAAYRLEGMVPTSTPSETERLLPHIRRLRELLAGAKDDWNRLCAGTAAALPPFHERTGKIAEEGKATGQADYQRLTAAVLEIADHLRRDPSRHNDILALEMATALLLAESALENFQSLDADFTHSVDAVVERLAAVERGEELGMLDLPHLDAMSRRAQERLLLESVAREIKSNLGTIETALDAFFRDSSKQAALAPLQAPIRQIQGALMVLGQDRANEVLTECASAIERFSQPGFTAQPGEFEDVAKKLSALGFFVTQLQGGSADIDAILAPPVVAKPVREEPEPSVAAPAAPEFAAEPAPAMAMPVVDVIEAAPQVATEVPEIASPPEPAPDITPVAEGALPDFEVEGFAAPAEPEPTPAPAAVEAPAPSAETERLMEASEEDLDAELLGIFLEEANEVMGTINQNLPTLHASPSDQEALVTVRRSFHTLKGSGRMVGLADLGEAGWGVEQVLNAWMHDTKPASPALLEMLDLAATIFGDWVTQLEAGGSRHYDYSSLARHCAVLSGAEDESPAEAPAPELALPETVAQEAAAPEVTEPQAPAAEIAVPETAATDAMAAELPLPEVAEPEIALPEVAAPEVPQPEVTEPEFALPEVTEPKFALPEIAAPEFALPKVTEPEVALPEIAAPEFALPEVTEPEVALPEFAAAAEFLPEAPALTSSNQEALALEPPAAEFAPPEAPPQEAAPEAPVETVETVETIAEAVEPASADVVAFPSPPPVRIGDVEISPVLYNLYIEETRQHVATLQANLGQEAVPGNEVIRAAHTAASISAATGVMPISTLARALEDALGRLALIGATPTEAQRYVFARCAGALEGMLGAVAQRRMPGAELDLTEELKSMNPAIEPVAEMPEALTADATAAPAAGTTDLAGPAAEAAGETEDQAGATAEPALPEVSISAADRRAARMGDEIDEQILPLFLEESVELMRLVGETLRQWRSDPASAEIARSLQRALHTLKGSARMAGAMGCGELMHSMEDRIDQAVRMKSVQPAVIDGLETSYDRAEMLIERLRNPNAALPEPESAEPAPQMASVMVETAAEQQAASDAVQAAKTAVTAKDTGAPTPFVPAAQVHLRVRADLVDQLVNEAGEVAIARGRIEGELLALKTTMLDLTENVIRLRKQLREVEIQAESQMQSQQALASERAQEFDPLEFDRFTRFQEVTRMMAESVNDVATVQQTLMRTLDHANAAVVAQARLSRELSQRLMGVRMVPFESIAERLHRVVRQAAKDTGKRANLDIRHGQTDLDRSVLDKMAGPLEHMLRNSVAHGLESTAARIAAGKDPIGQITVSLAQEGNEIAVAISDDGAGLNLEKIRHRAIDRGLLEPGATPDEHTLTQMILQSGFSTAEEVTTLAGRGVGMDVVRNETASLGGRIEISTVSGRGATFRVYLPLTLAVTQVVLVAIGSRRYAVPSSMIAQATEHRPAAAAEIRSKGGTEWLGNHYPYHYLGVLLGDPRAMPPQERRHWMLLVRGGTERVALEVDSLSGNQEVVVKAVGPQLARIPGLAGATVLANGEIALILNPVALAARAAERAGLPTAAAAPTAAGAPEVPAALTSTTIKVAGAAQAVAAAVMVVDDSLTVRKISGRLLARHGYNVLTAKDGVDALEQLADVMPDVMLLDIEMPRMDGFDLARNIRGDKRLKHIPLIMITSRTADKHRHLAMEIGVNHYLGKPYDEDDLLECIRLCLPGRQ
jgi:chemosensory pili system protein ChpA (sensor histidine kinase/response regulator)